MNDMVFLKSNFITSIISKILTSFVKKAGYDAEVRLNGISVDHKDGGKVLLRANISVDATEKDIHKLMKNL